MIANGKTLSVFLLYFTCNTFHFPELLRVEGLMGRVSLFLEHKPLDKKINGKGDRSPNPTLDFGEFSGGKKIRPHFPKNKMIRF